MTTELNSRWMIQLPISLAIEGEDTLEASVYCLACIIHNISNNAVVCPAFRFIMNNPG